MHRISPIRLSLSDGGRQRVARQRAFKPLRPSFMPMNKKRSSAPQTPAPAAAPKTKARQSPPPPVLGAVGAKVREVRVARGISQDHLAYGMHMDRAHIGLLENGKRAATIPTLARLAVALGCQVGDFFPDVEELAELLGVEAIEPKVRGAD